MATKKRAARKTVKKAVKRSAKTAVRRSPGKVSKRVKKGLPKKGAQGPEANLEKIGEVTHFFPHVKAAAVLILRNGVKAGDAIYIKGFTTKFTQKIVSMQLDHVAITEARKGDEIGLAVKSRVRIGDAVYRT